MSDQEMPVNIPKKSEENKDCVKNRKRKRISGDVPIKKVMYGEDSSYKFVEPKLEKISEPFEYSPEFFMRTHSKNNDPADVQTQIWQCAFEPDLENMGKQKNVVATCGGTSVCFIEVDTGVVALKYNRNSKISTTENLYALAWSSIPLDEFGLKKINVLAAGGVRSTVVLIHPEVGCCYQIFRTVPNKASVVVNALLFHPKKASWLFCAHDDGHIQLWDIGLPPLPTYEVSPRMLLTIPKCGGEIYNLVFSQSNDLLIAGCENGLIAWKVEMEKVEKCHRLKCIMFFLPDPNEDGTLVDSICLLRDNILAVKCALHGSIYIFNLSKSLKKAKENQDTHQDEVDLLSENLLKLRWSDTDNYYMNMGVDKISGTLVCGDDKGSLWVYDLYPFLSGEIESPLLSNGKPYKSLLEPMTTLYWPDLEDPEVEKARKLRLDSHDIVVDKCTVSDGGKYIVAVTNNNMVCIWKRDEVSEKNN